MSYDDWKEVNFSELGRIVTGKTPKTKIDRFWNGTIPFITPKDIQVNKYVHSTERYITEDGLATVSSQLLPKKSICVSCIGNIGYVGFTNNESISNQQINSIIPNEEYDSDYVYYLMKNSWPIFKSLENQSTTVSILNKSHFSALKVRVTKNNVKQKAIANILSSLDDKIELNNKINKNLEEMAQALYKQWFVDFEFPNEDGEPYKSSGGDMIESELGLIPKGWGVVRLGDILSLNKRGLAPKYTDDLLQGIPVINQRCIRNHTIIEEAVQYHDNNQKVAKEYQYHKEWDVLVNSMGVGTLGRVSVSSRADNKLVHSCVTILRSNDKISNEIFAQIMLSLEPTFTAMGEGSTGQTSIKNNLINEIKIVLPSRSIQLRIESLLRDIQTKIDINYLESKNLSETINRLLPKLMSGEIEVPIKG